MLNTQLFKNKYFLLGFIVLVGIVLRLIFSAGHIFSDDAYYSYLSKVLFDEIGFSNYLGYPIIKLRLTQLFFTNFSYNVFGFGEFATLVFPFLLSSVNLVLTFKLVELITEKINYALLAVLLMAFFPTDIIFATINFVDLQSTFFINSGILFLIISNKKEDFWNAVFAGLLFALSLQFKETFYFHWILLAVLFIYFALIKRNFVLPILVSLLVVVFYLLAEGIFYFLAYNNFFFRLHTLQANYLFSYYDFFPYTAQKISDSNNYLRNLFDQLILINGRSVFLRRFYLFMPGIAAVQSFINIKRKELLITTFWFLGLALMMIVFTTSFTEYKPLDLKRSWYIYPLIMPAIILAAQFIFRFNFKIKIVLITAYIAGSIIMSLQYQSFFDIANKAELKKYLRSIPNKTIFTDHFTKYSVDLIRSDEQELYSKRILGNDFNWDKINSGDIVLFNRAHIDELELQKFDFPDFQILSSNDFKKINEFNDFIFYQKN